MYRDHWGLREAPFRGSLDPRSFYQTPNAEEALARLHFLVEEHRRVGVCFGPPGGGKSMLTALDSPFALSARARGEAEVQVSLRHALRHAALPERHGGRSLQK